MAGERQDIAGKRKRGGKDRGKTQRLPLPAHRLFVPLLGVWGAALGGLTTLVLPRPMVFDAAFVLGLGALGALAPFVLAATAALFLGAVMLMLARALARKAVRPADTPSLAAMAMRHVRTIDPATELGSGSLDEPVVTQPFAARRRQAKSVEDPPQSDLPAPRALDLGEFAALAGRNGVWVEEPATETFEAEHPDHPEQAEEAAQPAPDPYSDPANEREAAPAPVRAVSPSAIERLRAVPPSELSLVHMVERFAAAMHEHKAAEALKGDRADLSGRDAALAEALKALAVLSHDARENTQSEPLRTAISRLQELRGAA
ncbi:hypothetical protein J3454_07710 [Erythrobacter sp. NFXS35]|uniref:hypothetical protein n=1 Tax=Erythrobacter sp. NFXS35 TaxID=2818436 RepID=UPI0032DFA881